MLKTVDQKSARAYIIPGGLLTLSDAAIGPNKARGPGSFFSDAWKSSSKALVSSIYATAGYSLVGTLDNFPVHLLPTTKLGTLGVLHDATCFKKCHSRPYPYTSSTITIFPPC